MIYLSAAMIGGYLLDLLLGDPRGIPHPVCAIGKLIQICERMTRRLFPDTDAGQRAAGTVTAVLVILITTAIPCILFYFLWQWNHLIFYCLQGLLFYRMVAVKSLKGESMKVYRALVADDLEKAREAVSMIVGRDTENLSFSQVAKAAVETVAESTSDGIVAPMFYMAIGGVPLVYFYKAINTMDSMIGYKNDRYLYFGRTAAKLDDIVNYLPSRIAACCMIAAAYFLRFDAKTARKIYKRDRRNHASPNSAQTESVCAGALNVQLAGNAYYFGTLYEKPTIGDPIRPVEAEDIVRTNRLMYATSLIAVLSFSVLRIGLLILIGMIA